MRRVLKAAALVALLAAAAVAVPERSSQTIESHTFDHQTEKKQHALRVPDAARVRLHVKASVSAGEIKILVRDPAGVVRQDARLAPSKSRPSVYDVDSGEVRSPAGVWTVEVEAREAVGRYEFAFKQYQ